MPSNAKVLDAIQRIEQQVAQKQYRSGILKLADALSLSLRIPPGNDLVLLLQDDPRIRTNREAVAAWVQAQLADPCVSLSQHAVPVLLDLLSRKLRSIYEGTSCL